MRYMKYMLVLSLIITLGACSAPLPRNSRKGLSSASTSGGIDKPPSVYNSMSYNSVSDLINGLLYDFTEEVLQEIEQEELYENKGAFQRFLTEIKEGFLYVPYYDGEEMPLRSREGFQNITLFPAGSYNYRPKIWFYPKEQINVITLFYLDGKISRGAAERKCSEILRELSPTAPNIDNYEQYQSIVDYTKIYDSKLELSDRIVTVLVQELAGENQVTVSFVYDEVFVGIEISREVLSEEWLKKLSFERIQVK